MYNHESIHSKEVWTSTFVQYGWEQMQQRLNEVVIGKPEPVRLACLTMLAGGHLLLEDVPGVGKTLLARALAQLADGTFRRVQMTPDMMPADITGSMVLDPATGVLRYSEGPLAANVVLADELNRASARTQSALLEAMEERSVTVDGVTRPLPEPFMIVATQNPLAFEGTYRLPEAELDRFMTRLSLGYPDVHGEADMLVREQSRIERVTRPRVQPVFTPEEWALLIRRIRCIHVDDTLCRYMADIAQATRTHEQVVLGVSPRGTVALMQAAQAQAFLSGRAYVIPDDVKVIAAPVLAHRLVLKHALSQDTAGNVIRETIASIPIPSFTRQSDLDGAARRRGGMGRGIRGSSRMDNRVDKNTDTTIGASTSSSIGMTQHAIIGSSRGSDVRMGIGITAKRHRSGGRSFMQETARQTVTSHVKTRGDGPSWFGGLFR
ncbi:MoxR family ATPase [Paenibacillus sp. ACRRX]|uniref:AAA family ATPase n=1 Tax=Paenibacillus sp. ACRRX TaxID=2918206 RepID=UPI001EF3EBE9|nr:MoxR family ATPase [Paenibacillus sp. ACRRX]MCG7408425.1 MoxR family ATPase [Paenibacillus sp. ACRRX]